MADRAPVVGVVPAGEQEAAGTGGSSGRDRGPARVDLSIVGAPGRDQGTVGSGTPLAPRGPALGLDSDGALALGILLVPGVAVAAAEEEEEVLVTVEEVVGEEKEVRVRQEAAAAAVLAGLEGLISTSAVQELEVKRVGLEDSSGSRIRCSGLMVEQRSLLGVSECTEGSVFLHMVLDPGCRAFLAGSAQVVLLAALVEAVAVVRLQTEGLVLTVAGGLLVEASVRLSGSCHGCIFVFLGSACSSYIYVCLMSVVLLYFHTYLSTT